MAKEVRLSFCVAIVGLVSGPVQAQETEMKAKAAMIERGLAEACDAQDINGCLSLAAWDFEMGNVDRGWQAIEQGLAIDKKKAVVSQKKACGRGSAAGCYCLGLLYGSGKGVGRDPAKAFKLKRRACDGGYAPGCAGVGDAYRIGFGVPIDRNLALRYYEAACAGGVPRACLDAALGIGSSDPPRFAQLVNKACDGGVDFACQLGGRKGKSVAEARSSRTDVPLCQVEPSGTTVCGAVVRDNGGVAQVVVYPGVSDALPVAIAEGVNTALREAAVRYADVKGMDVKIRVDESVAFFSANHGKVMAVVETRSGMFLGMVNGKQSGDYFDQEKQARLPETTRARFRKMVGF
jgi:TPR repeat protein